MSPEIIAELAPGGVLRAGLNLSNFLLVSGKTAAGGPAGVAPDMAAEIGRRLGVPVQYVSYKTPGELADAAETGAWDIGLIGAEPQRAEKIAFTPAYVEIEATYLVPAGSPIRTLADVDRPGVRISVTGRSAYGLWLDRHIAHATLVQDRHARQRLRAIRDATSWRRWPASSRGCSPMSRSCPARASSTASSPPCSRRSVRRAKIPRRRRSCASSWRR